MPINCPSGTSTIYRYKKTKKGKIRLGGCARKGRFIKSGVKEAKMFPNNVVNNIIGNKIKKDKHSKNQLSGLAVLDNLRWWWEHYDRSGSLEPFEEYVYRQTGKSIQQLENE